jgi:eukaryotic-like serine/threonine-protein kinase
MPDKVILHYEILEKLGEGGMGVVYKARDTTLDRFVALKFLPEQVSASAGELQRFVQEAKAAAALNHPNICTIYGIEQAENKTFIAMEFVDGLTLQEKKSSLSMKQAIDIGIQVAEGLAAAHEKGIVHRDIKPENIMIRKDGRAQIMDFGLAKLFGASRLTKEGSTVGTARYMSPEQVQGQDTDHRSDIFSLGVLLFEMLTKQLPFNAAHETAIAYEIVNVDPPPMSSVNAEIPAELDAIVLECLEKDPNERTQSARQVAIDLKRYKRESSKQRASMITAARPALSSSRQRVSLPAEEIPVEGPQGVSGKRLSILLATAAVVMFLAGYGISFLKNPPVVVPPIRSSLETPPAITYYDAQGGNSCISPDGSRLAIVCTDSLSRHDIYVRSMATGGFTALAGTNGAQYPFWSADSKSIGFFADGKLKTVDANGGPVVDIADAPFGRGGAWNDRGTIIFSPSVRNPNLYAVSSSGKSLRKVTPFDSSSGRAPRFPFFLPDGNHFLFSYLDMQTSRSDIYAGSLNDTAAVKILDNASYAIYSSGYLFYLRQGILMAQHFEPKSFELTGSPVSVQGNINMWAARSKADFSVSNDGVLVYAADAGSHESDLVWFNANGTTSVITHFEQPFTGVALSPDEKEVAYDKADETGISSKIFIYNLETKTTTRLTYGEGGGVGPCWSRDGTEIFYTSLDSFDKESIRMKRADGAGQSIILVQSEGTTSMDYQALDESPDGHYLLLSKGDQSGSELCVVDLHDPHPTHTVEPLGLKGAFGTFSPDGKWILYGASTNGPATVYVASFKGISGKWQLPAEGADGALWGKGRVVFFNVSDEQYEECDVSFSSGIPVFAQPKPLFSSMTLTDVDMYAVSKGGSRYLCLRHLNSGAESSLSMIVNWKGLVSSN